MIKSVIVVATSVVIVAASCSPQEQHKSRYETVDGGYVTRKECLRPIDDCWTDCETRNASRTCIGCCRDQQFLCNTQQQHSFESCKGVP